jgi:hypothetical protein
VYTSCGVQSYLQVQDSLASFVKWDNELFTKTRTLHTLNVSGHCNRTPENLVPRQKKRQEKEQNE